MNAQAIIDTIRETRPDMQGILDALEDGAALAAIGVTDADQEEVEEAHAEIKEAMRDYAHNASENGEVDFEGKSYALEGQAELSCRLFDGCWSNVDYGDEYTAEWSCTAIGEDGQRYEVTWRWQEVKGEEQEDASNYNWDDTIYSVDRV